MNPKDVAKSYDSIAERWVADLFGLEAGQFKYCEPHDDTYRCRSSKRPRQWMPGNQVPLPR